MINSRRIRGLLILFALLCAGHVTASAQVDWETTTHDRGQIRFARGKSSAVVRGRVTRADRDQYLLRARAGQWMTVRFDSTDTGAGFDVYAATGLEAVPVTEADRLQRQWTGQLPEADEYYINVLTPGPGGAYTFEVRIQNTRPPGYEPDGIAPPDPSLIGGGPALAREFGPVLARLKRAGVPVLLPDDLPRSVREDRLYVEGGPSADGYEVVLTLTPDCGGANACTVGSFTAERGVGLVEELEQVELIRGIRGAYKGLTCGASCSPAMIQWVSDGVLYTIQLKLNAGGDAGDKRELLRLANSSIDAGPR